MQEYKLNKRIKNGDRVVSYILTDRSGGHIEVDPDSLKGAVKAGDNLFKIITVDKMN